LFEEVIMSEKELKARVKELETNLLLKNKQIKENLDKIENLEDLVMELENFVFEKADKEDIAFLKLQLKDLEIKNRDLKNRLSISKLENSKLKQALEKVKKGQQISPSLIQIIEDKSLVKSGLSITEEVNTKEESLSHDEQFKFLQIKCPKCETRKDLKIPKKILNQSHRAMTLNVPKGLICEHKFQLIFDKSLSIKQYQVIDFDVLHLEYYETKVVEDSKNVSQFAPLPFFQNIINLLRSVVDDREILGVAVFTKEGKVIYSLVPIDMLFNIIKEYEYRMEKQVQAIAKMYLVLKNRQKICSEYIKIQHIEYNLVLVLSASVNFGMGTMLFNDIKNKIKTPNL